MQRFSTSESCKVFVQLELLMKFRRQTTAGNSITVFVAVPSPHCIAANSMAFMLRNINSPRAQRVQSACGIFGPATDWQCT